MSVIEEIEAELAAADWRDIPAGWYAIPLVEDDLDDDDPNFCRVIGHKLFERKTGTVLKNGRRRGKDYIKSSLVYDAQVGEDAMRAYVQRTGETRTVSAWDVIAIRDAPEVWGKVFADLTGRCCACNRVLTDPESKVAGMGPACRGY